MPKLYQNLCRYLCPQGGYEAVKEGVSWPAFFFTSIWAFVNKLWLLGVGSVLVYLVFGVVFAYLAFDIFLDFSEEGLDELMNMIDILGIINIGTAIIFAVIGNDLKGKNFLARGYDYKETVTAPNLEGALALYIKNSEDQETANK